MRRSATGNDLGEESGRSRGVSRLLGFFEAGFERVGDLQVLMVGWFGGVEVWDMEEGGVDVGPIFDAKSVPIDGGWVSFCDFCCCPEEGNGRTDVF